MPIEQKITYSLLASIFPISSTRPATGETRRADGAIQVQDAKDASSELTLLYLMHFANWMVWSVVYIVLMQVSPNFVDGMKKIEESSGFDSNWVIFFGCPVAFLFSILSCVLYNKVQPWSLVSDASDCLSCCPPKLKSSYRKILVEEMPEEIQEEENRIPARNVEKAAVELEEIFEVIRHKHNNQ